MSLFRKLFKIESKKDISAMEESARSIGNMILEFQNSIFKSIEWSELNNVLFAMWLPSNDDRQFVTSPIREKWTIIYSITKSYWSYIAADILKTLKLVDQEEMRIELPDDHQSFGFLTADHQQVILSLSKEKGIRIHFAETTPLESRKLFLDKFICYCNAWKDLVNFSTGYQDDDLGFEEWWKTLVEASLAIETKEPLKGVGRILI